MRPPANPYQAAVAAPENRRPSLQLFNQLPVIRAGFPSLWASFPPGFRADRRQKSDREQEEKLTEGGSFQT